jgi:glycosyltransferase involved in cell wall biosynthesis
VLVDVAVAERWSGALARAQAMARPLVVSERTTPPAGVEGSETGFAVPRRDPHAIAERLALLAGDPALRRRMGAAGRARATQRSRDYLADFDALYRATLAA